MFKIIGEINKPNDRMPFTLEVREVKADNALERVYSELGGQHKAKRFQIKIMSIEEVQEQV